MKKIIVLLFVSVFLMACSVQEGIKDGDFNFSEEEFQEKYEEINDMLMNQEIGMESSYTWLYGADKYEMLRYIKTLNEFINDDELNKFYNTIEADELAADDIVNSENLKILYLYSSVEEEYRVDIFVRDKE